MDVVVVGHAKQETRVARRSISKLVIIFHVFTKHHPKSTLSLHNPTENVSDELNLELVIAYGYRTGYGVNKLPPTVRSRGLS